jgi:serine/threonine protein phosphatase 1
MFRRLRGEASSQSLGLAFDAWPSRIYAIGDIHGRHDLLLAAQRRVLNDSEHTDGPLVVVQLGDAIDRGPKSADVLAELRQDLPGIKRINLMGNHEFMLLDFIRRPDLASPWLEHGGIETLRSFGLEQRELASTPPDRRSDLVCEVIGQETIEHIAALPAYAAWPGLCLVHAGLRPGIAIKKQKLQDLIWIREPFLSAERNDDLLVVHGHTPTGFPDHGPGRIGIDTAAYLSGVLTTICLERDRAPRFLPVGPVLLRQ